MHVIAINGSPNPKGCTFTALTEVANTLAQEGITSEIIHLGNRPVRDCIGCGACRKLDNQCVFGDDAVNAIIAKIQKADGLVVGSPVYFAHPSGHVLSALDRIFYAGRTAFTHKPAMAVVSARRGGTTASFDVLNKYFTIAQMPVVSSTYWNMVHGNTPDQVLQDAEGLQTMRNGARNMAWLLRCIQAGQQAQIPYPQAEGDHRTNFIR